MSTSDEPSPPATSRARFWRRMSVP